MEKIDKSFLYRVIIIGVVIFIINCFFYQICFINGVSMEPTFKDKEIVFIKKYGLDLKNDDIVVIKKNKKIIIKRLIGLPNDIVKIDDYVYVNGNKNDNIHTTQNEMEESEIHLKDGQYFVLGDNRDNSIDSRSNEIGIINRNEIMGIVISFKKEGIFND